jgi:hypothetical protein
MNYLHILNLLTLSFAFTYIVVTAKILAQARNFLLIKFSFIGELVSCLQCMSFWSGVIFSSLCYFKIINIPFESISFSSIDLLSIVIIGFLSSLYSVVFNSLVGFLNNWR